MAENEKSVKRKIQEQYKLQSQILYGILGIVLFASLLGVSGIIGKSTGYFVALPVLIGFVWLVMLQRQDIRCPKCNSEVVPGVLTRANAAYIQKIQFCPHCAADLSKEKA